MRVPGKDTPLVSLPEGGDGGRKYGLDLGSPGFRAGHNGMFSGPNRFYEPLAKGFEDVARATAMITKDMLMREDHAKVNEALTRFTEGELTPFLYGENGEFTKQGEQALGGTNRVADFFKNTPNRYTEGLSKNALVAFGEQINSRKMAVLSSTAQHEAKERNAWEIGTMQAAAQSDADFALNNFGDDRVFYDNFDRAMQQWGALADKQGLSGEQKKMFMQQQATSLQVGRIARFAKAGDHVRAFSELKHSNLTADARFKAEQEVGTAFFADMMKQGRLNPKATSEYFSAIGWKPVEVKNLPPQYVQALVAEGEKQGLAPEVIEILPRVMATESGGNPDAVSPAGAVGLMQLMPEAAKEMGVTDRRDPAQNIKGGVGYLAKKIKEFDGDVALGLMAYNWGAANVRAWLKTGKGSKGQPMPEETKAYVSKILGLQAVEEGKPIDYDPQSVEDLLTTTQKLELVNSNNAGLAEQRKLEIEAASSQEYSRLIDLTKDMNPIDAEVFMSSNIAKIENTDIQQNVNKKWEADKAIYDKSRAAQDKQYTVQLTNEVREGTKMPSKAMEEVRENKNMTFDGKEKLLKSLQEVRSKETPENKKLTMQLMVAIDEAIGRGEPMLDDDITYYALEHGLTNNQEKKALAYARSGGNLERLTPELAKEAYALTSENPAKARKEFSKDPALFEAIQRAMPPGVPPTRENVKKVVAGLRMDGEKSGNGFGYGRDMTGFKAVKQGDFDTWLPDVTREEEISIGAVLKENGVTPTPLRIRQYKKEYILKLAVKE